MTIERGTKFVSPGAIRTEGEIENDQSGAGIAEAIDQFAIDGPVPGISLLHLLQGRRALDLFRAYFVQQLGSLVDPEKDEFIVHLGPPRLSFESIAEIGFIRPDAVGEDYLPKSTGCKKYPLAKT